MDDSGSEATTWDAKFSATAGKGIFEREILIALQPIAGHRADWNALAAQVDAAPATWRWWIRRHPASRAYQDAEFGRLLSMSKSNVMIDEASALPLPVLLRHMSVLLCLASGAAMEAAMFAVPVLFLSEESRGPFAELIARGAARVVDIGDLDSEIARLAAAPSRQTAARQPALGETLRSLGVIAQDYALLCRSSDARRP
jgi:hypothetical protein